MPLGKYTISHKKGIFFPFIPTFFLRAAEICFVETFFFLSTLKEVEVENQVIFRTTKQIVSSS